MSGRVVIAVYKPRPGKEADLERLIREHVPRLQDAGLVSDRRPIIAKASDGTIVEVFEWISEDAIANAHANPVVTKLWSEFEACCWYETPANVPDFQRMFVSFDPLD